MSLHDRIMGIATHQKVEGFDSSEEARDVIQVRNEAAQIAKEADELMSYMVEALEFYAEDSDFPEMAKISLERHRKYKGLCK